LNAVATHLPRLVALGEGQIIADGAPEEVLTPEILRQVYGAEMLVLHSGHRVYVVDHPDDDLEPFGPLFGPDDAASAQTQTETVMDSVSLRERP
ncbi:MAG TPA: hypothetical protein QGF05_15135, partial [Dehalococcoidia bacterium]|nr:hypothetical protein [Dehalococcoidia bacterium]